MGLDVLFRDEADVELDNIYDSIASQGRPDTAIAYVRRIRDACMALAHFPERGNKRDDILPGLRTIGFERRATIVFRVWRVTWKSSASLTAAVILKAE